MAPEQCRPPAVLPIPLGTEGSFQGGALITARVEMTASLTIRFSIWKVEFPLVTHSCFSFSSSVPICRWIDLSFSVAVVLQWKSSTITFTLPTVGFSTFRASLTNKLILCARHGRWVHVRILLALVMLAALSLTQHTTLFSTSHSFAALSSCACRAAFT